MAARVDQGACHVGLSRVGRDLPCACRARRQEKAEDLALQEHWHRHAEIGSEPRPYSAGDYSRVRGDRDLWGGPDLALVRPSRTSNLQDQGLR
jgi:hypothetical protein